MLTDQDILTQAYKAFNDRDMEAVLAYMHPDVDWPNGMEGGRVQGHEGVRDYWTRQWNLIDPHVAPLEFDVEKDGRIVVRVHQVIRDKTGNILSDTTIEHVYLMQEGLILRMDIQE